MTTAESAYNDIHGRIIPAVIEAFREKARDYTGGPAFMLLGSKGQFSDINRKFWKLYAALWEGKQLEGEQPHEIVEDFIGHCFLLLWCLDHEAEEDVEWVQVMFSQPIQCWTCRDADQGPWLERGPFMLCERCEHRLLSRYGSDITFDQMQILDGVWAV